MTRTYLTLAVVFLLSACGNRRVSDLETSYKRVEITRDFLGGKSAELQFELVDTISLEQPENPPLQFVVDIAFADEFILLVDNKQGLFKFDYDGNIIQRIGARGEGPEEYSMPYAIHLDEKENTILVADWQKRLVISYDLNGDFNSSSQRLPGHPISFYRENDTLLVVQEGYVKSNAAPRQVLLSSIEPLGLELKHRESPLYGYRSDFTIMHTIPRILNRINGSTLFYMPIIQGDIASHSASDTIFRKKEDQLVPEYLLEFTGFDHTEQLSINHMVLSDDYAFLQVGHNRRQHLVVVDLVNNRPVAHSRILFEREMSIENIPRPLGDGDLFYSVLRDEDSMEEKNPMIVFYRVDAIGDNSN